MAIDKDTLIKHHFWIVLGLAVVLLPVVASGVVWGVADSTDKERKKIDEKTKALRAGQPKGADYLAEQEKQKSELEGSKGKVWAENYDKQKGLIEWPSRLAQLNSLYFGDDIKDEDINTFRKADVYLTEFESLADLIKPTELNGGWKQVMSFVPWGDKRTSPEEAWLALEDICIQRELLRCVDAVNKLLAKCERDASAETEKALQEQLKPEADESVYRFVNPYWHLDFAIRKAVDGAPGEFMVRGKLKNVSHRRLSIGRIDFLLSLIDPKETQARAGVLSVEGDFLQVGDSVPFKDKTIRAPGGRSTVYAVEQRLDARYVPVKRVDRIVIGYHSHRTADKALTISKMSEKAKASAPAAAADPAAAGGAPAPAGAAPAADRTPSGINRARYITVTEQVRRMPIGLVFIVDQAHVQDVLRAFANSRLRFQTTQFHCTHYRGGGGTAATPGTATSTVDPTNVNLVEMSLYGLASIYEKFPPKGEPAAPAK